MPQFKEKLIFDKWERACAFYNAWLAAIFRPHCSRHGFQLSTQIYWRNEHSHAGSLYHFLSNCYDDQKDVTRAGLCCTGHLVPLHTHRRWMHNPLFPSCSRCSCLCTLRRWKSTCPTDTSRTQNHLLHLRCKAAEGTEICKHESLFLAPSFSMGMVMLRSAPVWISPSLLPVWDTTGAVHLT